MYRQFLTEIKKEEVPYILAYWAAQLSNPWWAQSVHMAIEIHSIPAMSAEVEWAFSREFHNSLLHGIAFSGKSLLTECYSKMGDEVVEAIECMKSWCRAGLVAEKNVVEVEIMLKDLEDQAMRLAQGRSLGSSCSEVGSNSKCAASNITTPHNTATTNTLSHLHAQAEASNSQVAARKTRQRTTTVKARSLEAKNAARHWQSVLSTAPYRRPLPTSKVFWKNQSDTSKSSNGSGIRLDNMGPLLGWVRFIGLGRVYGTTSLG
ncbi:hypothetical protein HOY80DRAFT_1002866 [Tuber brumale]|nr:hypothetical protein HOY80DRAFT_1002866 [Tuber brumale]